MHTDSNPFSVLLRQLDSNGERAAEKYLVLKGKLEKLFSWKHPSLDADTLADVTLDRVAIKLSTGEKIENISAYTLAVARFVGLEAERKNLRTANFEKSGEYKEPSLDYLIEEENSGIRLSCFKHCLAELTPQDQQILTGYFSFDKEISYRELSNIRKDLANKLGLKYGALRVKILRIRVRLEDCVKECVRKKSQ
jgi:hypothetical protein